MRLVLLVAGLLAGGCGGSRPDGQLVPDDLVPVTTIGANTPGLDATARDAEAPNAKIVNDSAPPEDAATRDVPTSCPTGFNLCAGACVAESPTSCGATCRRCDVPAHGIATCSQGTCGMQCASPWAD